MPIGMVLSFVLIAQNSAVQPRPSGSYLCNYAKVQEVGHLQLRAGPGLNYRAVAQLSGGTIIYICDEHRNWYHVFYAGAGKPCVGSDKELDSRKRGSCKSGWAMREQVNVLSG